MRISRVRRNALAGQPVIRVIERPGVHHTAAAVASGDFQKPLPIPGKVEPRGSWIVQLPGVPHASLIVVIEFEQMNSIPSERMEIAVSRESDRRALARRLEREPGVETRAVPQREKSRR